ncbi:MAG: class I SAM-dependent methyltransferase [Actinocrinis sp.]
MRPVGTITRGTTAPNRLRRVDRWLVGVHGGLLRGAPEAPLVIDLGYGAYPVTTVELAQRLRAVRSDVQTIGLEIDPERVAAAQPYARPGLEFRLGGFELPVERAPTVIRAFNVLRQYDESEVADVWRTLTGRLSQGGLLVEGTCSENGRVAAWVTLDRDGPRTLTLAARLGSLESPAVFAERLPKALIHRNVPGEPVHAFLRALDRAWLTAAPFGDLGVRQRWTTAVGSLLPEWPILGRAGRRRLGEVTVAWSAVAPPR